MTADFVGTLMTGRSNPGKLTVALTMALNAVRKGHSTLIILMMEAVELGKPGAADGLDIGAPFEPAAALLDAYLAGGGRLAVCKSCLIHNGMTEAEMDPRHAIITGGDVVDLLMTAKGSLQMG